MAAVIKAFLLRNKKVVLTATANLAVNNIAGTTFKKLFYDTNTDNYVAFRAWSSEIEYDLIENYDSSNIGELVEKLRKDHRKNTEFGFDMSLSKFLLVVGGVIETKNPKLREISGHHSEFARMLKLTPAERNALDDERSAQEHPPYEQFRTLLKHAARSIYSIVDPVCTTIALAGQDTLIVEFVDHADAAAVDEAGSSTELEILITWRANRPLILAGDPAQLPPFVLSDMLKNRDGKILNTFANTVKISLLHRFIENSWPYLNFNEQKRMAPGLFDLANFACYGNVVTAPGVNIDSPRFLKARLVEQWMKKNIAVGDSPDGKVWPVFIDVDDSFCYAEEGGTSKGNTATAHYTMNLIRRLLEDVKEITVDDFVVIVPYTCQEKLYKKVCASHPELKDLYIVTSTAYQGREKPIVFADFVAAANLGGAIGFVADKKRMAVTLTRQADFLVVLGDSKSAFAAPTPAAEESNVWAKPADADPEPETKLDESNKQYELDPIKNVFEWFGMTHRVLKVSALNIESPELSQTGAIEAETWEK